MILQKMSKLPFFKKYDKLDLMNKTLRKEYIEKAFLLHNAGKIQEAKNFYNKIIGENPKDSEVLNLIGICEFQNKDFESAKNYVTKAIEIKPTHYFYETLSLIYAEENDYEKELSTLLDAQKYIGLDYNLAFRLAYLYKQLKDYKNAEKYYILALQQNPKSKEAYFNLATMYSMQKKYINEKECYIKALEIDPSDEEIKYFLALNNFRLKNYEMGLPYFESRLCRQAAIETQKHTYPNLISENNLWRGEDISDKTLYTYFEADTSDMIMFARYLPLIKCKKLIVKPQAELVSLFKDNFPNIEVMETLRAEKDLNFDVHIPFMSIPYALNLTTKKMFTSSKKYLKSNGPKVKKLKKEYFNTDKMKIGIALQDDINSYEKLFKMKNTQVYSLQKNCTENLTELSEKYNVIDISESLTDYSYTAAAIKNLDLVICNDTSIAHLAGAMNKPCIMMLPYNYSWKWHTDVSGCDWYKSVKLFVANKDESFDSLMNRVIDTI